MNQKPTHIVYHVKDIGTADESELARSLWIKVGAAWQHNDGKGLTITLDVIPFDPRLVLRENKDKEDIVEIS